MRTWRKTFYDTNRLKHPAQRMFHSAWAELRGERIWLTRTIAGELSRERLERGDADELAAARAARQARGAAAGGRRYENELWWLDQMCGGQGIMRVHAVEEEEARRIEDARRSLDDHFAGSTGGIQGVRGEADAAILCEVLASGGSVVLTQNIVSMRHDLINEWAMEYAEERRLEPRELVLEADATIAADAEREEGRSTLMQTVCGLLWSKEHGPGRIEADLPTYLELLERAELPLVATVVEDEVAQRRRRGTWTETLSQAGDQLPGRTRAQEETHPKFGGWGISSRAAAPRREGNLYLRAAGHVAAEVARWDTQGRRGYLRKTPRAEPAAEYREKGGRNRAREAVGRINKAIEMLGGPDHDEGVVTGAAYQAGVAAAREEIKTLQVRGRIELWEGARDEHQAWLRDLREAAGKPPPEWVRQMEGARRGGSGRQLRHMVATEGYAVQIEEEGRVVFQGPPVEGRAYWEGLVQARLVEPDEVPHYARTLEREARELRREIRRETGRAQA